MSKMKEDSLKSIAAFMQIASQPGFASIFGGMIQDSDPVDPYPYERLGDGYELRPIEILAEGGQFVLDNREEFSNLYHYGLKVSDEIFRKGGMGGKFVDGYCSLIQYIQKSEHTQKRHGFDFGTHVIINQLGEIVFKANGSCDYPSHCGGNVGKLKDTYYNLKTGEPILTASSSGTISSKNLIIIEHRYDWYNKSLPLGIYTINKTTCEITKIDDIK
jgi:hypothetical protein